MRQKTDEQIAELLAMLKPCTLCPRMCRAERINNEQGYCNAPYDLVVSSAFAHFGEEPPLVGKNGSGTVFFTHCNLKCLLCQNYDISIYGEGVSVATDVLANTMLALQGQGCHNINLVTPTHYVPQIVKTLSVARDRGLTVPIVYNCGGYESIKAIRLLDGIVDIYMPDIKFLDPGLSMKYCRAEDYPEVVRGVIREMYRQVGDLVVDERGIAKRGLLIRHLLMPGCLDDAKNILRFIKDEISADAYVNIMAQYHLCYRAGEFNELSAGISPGEYREALSFAGSIGLTRAATH